MDFRSDTFQLANRELNSMENLDRATVASYLQSKNIDKEEFREANKNYQSFLNEGKDKIASLRAEGKTEEANKLIRTKKYTVKPEGTRFGRGALRLFGEVGEDVRDLASMVAPKTVEAIGDYIPDPIKDHVNRMFDPYMGEGLGADVTRGVAEIGSYILPGTQLLKIGKGAKAIAGIKGVQGIGKKAFKKRRIIKNTERGVAAAAGFTIAEDSAADNQYNAMLDIADQLGGEGQSGVTKFLNKFTVDENDSEAIQKLNSFALNLMAVPMFASIAILKTPLARAQALKKIADKAAKAKKQKLAIDVIPTSVFGKIANTFGIRNLLYREFSTSRGTDKFTRDRILKREAAGKKVLKEIDGVAQDLTKAVNKSVSTLPKAELHALVNGVLDGDPTALTKLLQEAPDVARIARQMTKNIKDARRPVAGNIKNVKLKAIYDPDTKKVWLNRTYRIYDDPSFSRKIKDIPTEVRAGVEHYLRTQLKVPEDKMEGAIKKLLAKGNLSEKTVLDFFNPLRKQGSTQIGGSSKVFKARTKLGDVKAIRALWGEVKDPYKNYMNSMVKLSKMEADASFLSDMAKYLKANGLAKTANQIENRSGPIIGDWDDFVPLTVTKIGEKAKIGKEGEDFATATLRNVFGKSAVEGYTQPIVKRLKDKKGNFLLDKKGQQKVQIINKKIPPSILNPLEGLYVNPNYKDFLNEGTDVLAPDSALMKNWMRYKVATQTSKTIYNPGTHGRNTMGNMVLMVANGMNPFKGGLDSFKAAAEKLTGKSNTELGKRLGRYQELGITESGVKQEIIRRSANQVFNFDAKTVGAKLSKAMKSKANPANIPQNLYQIEDDFFKIMHFEKTINSLKKVFPKGTPIDVIEEEAARRTRDLMPNYNLVGKRLKKMRALPVGDYMAFPAEMVRVSKNLTRDTIDDITGNTAARLGIKNKEAQKKLKNLGYTRLAGMTAAATAGIEAKNFSANLFGITGEDQAALARLQPSWEQGTDKIYLSGIGEDKNLHQGVDYINMGPIDPFSYFKAPVMLIATELADVLGKGLETGKIRPSEDFNTRLGSLMTQLGGPFGGSSMSTEAIIKAYKVFDNDKLDWKEQSVEGAAALVDSVLPGAYTTARKQQKYRQSKEERKGIYNPRTGKYEDRGAVSDFDYAIPEVEMEGILGKAKWLGIRGQRLDITANMRRQLFPLTKGMDETTKQTEFMTNPNSPRDPTQRNSEFIKAYKYDQRKRLDKQKKLKKIIDAYTDLGLDYEDILEGMSRLYMKDIDKKSLVKKMEFAKQNKFLPSFIPKGNRREAELYTGGALPYKEVEQLFMKLLNSNLVDED
jgi:hypothetical protein